MATEALSGTLPETDAYVDLSLLDGGSFVGELSKIHAGVSNTKFRMYNWAFYISHRGRHVLWDLGLDEDRSCYTPWVNKFMLAEVNHVGPRRSIVAQLNERSVTAHQIDTVLFSHAHWDHCRPIRDVFPNATALFGPGTKEGCSPGHMANPDVQWDGRFFDPERATERWEELHGPWVPFGPFEKALDYFGDGSFWIMQAPGHMAGNLCAAARLRSGEWVLLGSDCCHSRELLDGKHEISQFCVPGIGNMSLHADIDAAKDTISKIRVLEHEHGFHVALAHDAAWMKAAKDKVLMSLLDESMLYAARKRIPKDKIA
ncbi:Metallo-hydrolase/oxidoreductase [Lentithecium fluviatile CBS 122367]|uniref:Metallo-hydrolase/oxidoreductase n=1 Tax=Lentithecium fluviatile CBS 122367 TaxID=1168545 RepID=A0A6G1IWT9_9PLEO|nr:Metallo-hydrolase/oxidoreductase [Lentithecium fluviatile CBS 122367]